MENSGQLNVIKSFINSSIKELIINDVNDHVKSFYISLFNFYANKANIKINYDDANNNNDLFENSRLIIYSEKNTKNINKIIDNNDKKILITDYKNFKKYNQKFLSINSYHYAKDIKYLIQDEFKIYNNELIFFCKNNPALVFSEISKFLINDKNYKSNHDINNEIDQVFNIRSSIYKLKRNENNLKELYHMIKKEVLYKRLNFLIY